MQCGKASHGIRWWLFFYWELTVFIIIVVTMSSPIFDPWWSFIAFTIVSILLAESIRVISFPMVPLESEHKEGSQIST